MHHVAVYLRPSALEPVLGALAGLGISGISWSAVRGYGRQKEHLGAYREDGLGYAALPRVRLSFSCIPELTDNAVAAIRAAAATGAIGDGKIMVIGPAEAHHA